MQGKAGRGKGRHLGDKIGPGRFVDVVYDLLEEVVAEGVLHHLLQVGLGLVADLGHEQRVSLVELKLEQPAPDLEDEARGRERRGEERHRPCPRIRLQTNERTEKKSKRGRKQTRKERTCRYVVTVVDSTLLISASTHTVTNERTIKEREYVLFSAGMRSLTVFSDVEKRRLNFFSR